METQVWLVSTVRPVGDEMGRFVHFHRAMGFSRQILFFDDPNDPWAQSLQNQPDVTIIPCDAAHWEKFAGTRPDIIDERQIANANLALDMARREGADWLTHIDSDELILTDGRPIGTILDGVQQDVARFALREAIAPPGVAPHAFAADWFRISIPLEQIPARVPEGLRVGGRWLRGHIASKVAVRVQSPVERIAIHNVASPDNLAVGEPAGARLLHFNCTMLERWRALWNRRRDGTGTTFYGGGHRWLQGHEAWRVLGDAVTEEEAFDRLHRLAPDILEWAKNEGLAERIALDQSLFEPQFMLPISPWAVPPRGCATREAA